MAAWTRPRQPFGSSAVERAAMLRHALADRAGAGAELLTEFEPVLRAAGGRGLPVETQVVGDPGSAEPQVIRATTAALEQTLHVLPPQPVLLTVLATVDEVELYLTFRGALPAPGAIDLGAAAPPGSRWQATVDVDDAGAGCLEVRWPKAVHAWQHGDQPLTRPAAVIKVAAVDDHPIVLGGIVSWLEAEQSDIRVVGTATTVDGLLMGPGRHADVVLLDLDLGDGTTAERNVGAILAPAPPS